MKLSELRRFTIRKQMRVRFAVGPGTECLITETGLAQVPNLKQVPDFNLEESLGKAESFRVEAAGTGKSQTMNREQLGQMVAAVAPGAAAAAHDHEE